jgi:beta-galactosidase
LLLLAAQAASGQALNRRAAKNLDPSRPAIEGLLNPPEARRIIPLNSDWRFLPGPAPAAVTAASFDDRAWQSITVPHTWNRLGEYQTTRSPATDNRQGLGWYRLRFTPALARGERAFLQFDGVGNLAEVWLNGRKIGEHAGAFSRFRFDVTDALQAGRSNLLVVKADNSKPAPGSSTQHVIPLSGDFFIYGGLYRDVSLIATRAIHIDLMDAGGPGVYAHATQITEQQATVLVRARLRNDARSTAQVVMDVRIRDAEGRVVATQSQKVRPAPTATTEFPAQVALPRPHLWNGRADPYLYTFSVELRDGATVLDAVTEPLGIRAFRIDANQGFFLNGQHLPLQGVSRHQDRAGKGWALEPADHDEDMALIAELGANTVRFAHYQHAPRWFELADRYGMIVWAEIPFVNQAYLSGDGPTAELVANARQQLTELIRQNYNHPSVVTWSVGNEVDLRPPTRGVPGKSLGLLENLNALSREEDPHRPTVFADCCESQPGPPRGDVEILAGATDLIGYNRYSGWYYGKASDLGPTLDLFHARHPRLPLSVSEYGAGGAFTQHSDNATGGALDPWGRPHPEEYQAWYHEESWRQIRTRPYIWASWVWNMFDFAADLREEGEAIDLNDKGLVSYDRKRRKDAFYFYKAQWSADPLVHITGRRYAHRAYPLTDVRVYSNARSVSLTQNGNALGNSECPERVCVWRNVKLSAGTNTFIASADFGGRVVSDSVTWTAPDAARGLRIDAGDLGGHLAADGTPIGSDHFFSGGEAKLLNPGVPPDRRGDRKVVTGATDVALHSAYREGAFVYDLPLPNGQWHVTLEFAEPDTALAETRSFNVVVNGRTQLDSWSPAKAAGGTLKATQVRFRARVSDGWLRLRFEPRAGPAVLSALFVEP